LNHVHGSKLTNVGIPDILIKNKKIQNLN